MCIEVNFLEILDSVTFSISMCFHEECGYSEVL